MSVLILRSMPIGFFPNSDQGQISVGINLPPGSSLEKTNQVALNVEQIVMSQPEVKTVYSRIGSGSSPYSGSISVQLRNGVQTDPVIARLRTSLNQYSRFLVFPNLASLWGWEAVWVGRVFAGGPCRYRFKAR